MKTTKVTVFLVWYYASPAAKAIGKKSFYGVRGTRKEAKEAEKSCGIKHWPTKTWIQQKTMDATVKE
ncbi:hypothetical protein D0812_22065 [Vibrio owensii]|uniref:Uncharacterized protein n=1 Tax=Vibrio owensii TaxID=696485 RepID=A0AAP9KC10_9VIBR|nr:hypothetical protein [Vibrio owensii]AYO17077.1 hypothetical protein D0812_22065 [Vibrio owensii]QGH49224.1 hypothetical protein APZ19_19080 [Vibrio owensii]